MNRLIILDDQHCEQELAQLLARYAADVHLNMPAGSWAQDIDRLMDGLKAVQAKLKEVVIYHPGGLQKVQASEVLFIRQNGPILQFYLKRKPMQQGRGKLHDYTEELKGYNFLQINTHTLVNLYEVHAIFPTSKASLLMQNGQELAIQPEKTPVIMKQLSQLGVAP